LYGQILSSHRLGGKAIDKQSDLLIFFRTYFKGDPGAGTIVL